MSELFDVEVAARESPRALALVTAQGSLDFESLAALVRPGAAWLRGRAERFAPHPAGVALAPRLDIESLLWILAALQAEVPLLLQHSRVPSDERARQRRIVGAGLLPAWSALFGEPGPVARARAASVPNPHPPHHGGIEAEMRPPSASPSAGCAAPAAYVFTSGTTGTPKGVQLSRSALRHACDASAARLGWREDERWLLSLPPAHVGGLSVLLRCLGARRAFVLGPPRFDAETLARSLVTHRVTLLSLVPTMLHRLLGSGWRPPPHLRLVLLGGAAASPDLLRRAREACVPALPTWGMSETCAQICTVAPGTAPDPARGVGRPLPGMEVQVRDGELWVRGPSLFDGYREGEELVRPFDAEGYFRTGDLGRIDAEGNIHVVGRRADRIVSGGENVDPAEVEAVLLTVPGVRGACIFGVEDPEWGERVAAALILDEHVAVAAALHAVHSRLAAHQRPRAVAVVEAFATGASGKVSRLRTAEALRGRLRGVEQADESADPTDS